MIKVVLCEDFESIPNWTSRILIPSSSNSVLLPVRPPRIIRMRSSNDQLFEVIKLVASLSKTIKHLIEETTSSDVVFPPSYGGGSYENEDLKAFHEGFVKEVIVDQVVLFDLIMAALGFGCGFAFIYFLFYIFRKSKNIIWREKRGNSQTLM